MAKVAYLAQPLDYSKGTQIPNWADEVSRMVTHQMDEWIVYRPGNSWDVGQEVVVTHQVEALNREALQLADALIAILPSGVKSIGVPREIEWAVANGIPVLVYTDRQSFSLADVDTESLLAIGAGFGYDQLRGWLRAIPEKRADYIRELVFTIESEDAILPSRNHTGDAGYDLYASERVEVSPGGFRDVPTGVRVAFPDGVYGRITGRSSTWRTKGLLCIEGIIDTGYRGPLFAGVQNPSDKTVVIEKGERVAQLITCLNLATDLPIRLVESAEFISLPGDTRGSSGFGSTGK